MTAASRSIDVHLIAVSALAIALAACGDDSGSGSGGTSSTGDASAVTTTGSDGSGGDGASATGPGSGGDASGGAAPTASSTGGGGAAVGSGGAGGSGGGTSWEGVDPTQGIGDVTLVQGGFQFVEGPLWLADLGVLRWSDIPPARIHQLDGDDTVSIWRNDSGGSNGLALLPDGRILACEGAARRIAVSPTDAPAFTVVADTFLGDRFNAPNDAIARSDGNIYFTDPDYGLPEPDHEIGFNGVYRVDAEGAVHLVDDARDKPNGIALSPDESTLYVADNTASELWTYAVAPDGTTSEGAMLTATAPGPDGMTVDDGGNLYVTTSAGVEVRRADGTLWGTIAVPEVPANCSFGSADRNVLFITARTGLYRVQMVIPGPA